MIKTETLVGAISIIGSTLITFGLFYNIMLFNKFEIDITAYIDFGEGLLLLLPSLPKVIVILILSLMAFTTLSPSALSTDTYRTSSLYARLFNGFLLRPISIKLIFLASTILCSTFVALGTIKHSRSLTNTGIGLVIVYFIIHLPLVFRTCHDILSLKIRYSVYLPIVIYLVAFIFVTTIFTTAIRESRILNSDRNPNVKIILQNRTLIQTDNRIRYLGKTKDYIFMYDFVLKTSIVVPISQVAEIRFTGLM